MKITTIIGTRPEIIRLSSIIKKFDKIFDHSLIHTGQNYDYNLNEIFFKDLNLSSPKYYLNAKGNSSLETISNVIKESEKILKKIRPDAVFVLGDTNSCMSLLAAKKLKIPTFHYEAGNRCFDERVPEEINRKIVDHIADINLTYSDISKNHLLNENFPRDRVFKIGSPMFEVLRDNENKINQSKILEKLNLTPKKYFLCSFHREENIEDDLAFNNIVRTIDTINKKFNLPVIISTHPRTKKKLTKLKIKFNKTVFTLKPLNFTDYNFLQKNSLVVLSDSGTISEESSIQKFNALNIRETHERIEAIEEDPVIMTGLNPDFIIKNIKFLIKENKYLNNKNLYVKDYQYPDVSSKICKIILSYKDYVNRIVWKK